MRERVKEYSWTARTCCRQRSTLLSLSRSLAVPIDRVRTWRQGRGGRRSKARQTSILPPLSGHFTAPATRRLGIAVLDTSAQLPKVSGLRMWC